MPISIPPTIGSNAFVLTGAYRIRLPSDGAEDYEQLNSAILFRSDDERRVLGVADKELLVPFAETRVFAAGQPPEPLPVGPSQLAVLICYESMYPRLARERTAHAEMVVIITNDAGFGRSPVALAHARQGWSRAIETGRPLLRASQAGPSLVTDDQGRLLSRLALFEHGLVWANVQPTSGWTWYSMFGHLVGPVAIVLACFAAVWPPKQRFPLLH